MNIFHKIISCSLCLLFSLNFIVPISAQEEFSLENEALKVSVSAQDAVFQVLDKRTKRLWTPVSDRTVRKVRNFSTEQNSIAFDFAPEDSEIWFHAVLELVSCENTESGEEKGSGSFGSSGNSGSSVQIESSVGPEKTGDFNDFGDFALDVTLSADAEQTFRKLNWPPAFASQDGDRLALPIGSGVSLPVEEKIPWFDASRPSSGLRPYFSGHGVNMAFWGQCAADGSGLMAEVRTPDNSYQNIFPSDGRAVVEILWNADRGKFGYDRKIRFHFLKDGGYVKMAKIYRKSAIEKGLCVSFSQKLLQNPARRESLEKLMGAANIWCLSGNFLRLYADISGNHPNDDVARDFMESQRHLYREMYDGGMTHLLIGAGSTAKILEELNQMEGVLTSRYDIYQDVMDPSMYDQLTAVKGEWPKEAFPQDIRRDVNGALGKGWAVPQKDPSKPMVNCVHLCDRQSVPYVQKRAAEELTRKPYTARFIDVTACSGWDECYAPEHPMSRTDARTWKGRLLAVPGSEFNLILGSETGHEAFVPQCDYFEGMMSLIFARVPDAGRNMAQIWRDVPEVVEKYQLGERYRIPLWELVYHDCVVSYWYWGDSNCKLPVLMPKRDLFNALYGEPPMYVVTPQTWNDLKDEIFESYRRAEPISRRVGGLPMTNHCVLTEDWSVQQSEFDGRIRVTVNFGPRDFVRKDGKIVPAMDSIVEEE